MTACNTCMGCIDLAWNASVSVTSLPNVKIVSTWSLVTLAVLQIWIARQPPGFAFVTYKEPNDAQDAVNEMNGKELGKHPLLPLINIGFDYYQFLFDCVTVILNLYSLFCFSSH